MIKEKINEMIQSNPNIQIINMTRTDYYELLREVDVRNPIRKWKNIPIYITDCEETRTLLATPQAPTPKSKKITPEMFNIEIVDVDVEQEIFAL
jgi:hypothetical protein